MKKKLLQTTVPLKCKLTVSTRYSILDPRSFRESRIEFRGSSFEFRVSSFENQVSRMSFETLEESFKDLKQRFRGNDLILENKTIAMNKTINARLYSGKPAVECMQIFFRVVHFLQDTCGSLIYTVADDSKLQLALHQNAFTTLPAETSNFFLHNYNPERVCCFHLHDFNRPLKT